MKYSWRAYYADGRISQVKRCWLKSQLEAMEMAMAHSRTKTGDKIPVIQIDIVQRDGREYVTCYIRKRGQSGQWNGWKGWRNARL